MAPVPDLGPLVLDVTPAVAAWQRGEPNNGLVVMMAADSHNQSHHWVMMTEQPSPADRPTLRIAYERSESRSSRGVDERSESRSGRGVDERSESRSSRGVDELLP
jgi:hypothetical protein